MSILLKPPSGEISGITPGLTDKVKSFIHKVLCIRFTSRGSPIQDAAVFSLEPLKNDGGDIVSVFSHGTG